MMLPTVFPSVLWTAAWAAVLAGGLSSCQSSAAEVNAVSALPPPAVPIAQLDTTTALTYREYPTALQGRVNVDIRPQVEGVLDRVFVDEGAAVQAGQSLFKINDRLYREQLNTAQAGLHAAEATLTNAKLEVDKYAPLVQNKVVAPIQLQTAQGAYQAARAAVDQARASVAAARLNLGYTLIKAPVSGFVGLLPKRVGSLVGPSDAERLTLLSDVREVYAYFTLSEQDFLAFKTAYPGATLAEKLRRLPPVTLLLPDGSTYPQPGHVNIVAGQVEAGTGAISLRATFPNTGGLLRSGNTGRIRLTRRHAGALLVPQAATLEVQDKTFVYVLSDSNKVSLTPVSILDRSETNFLVQGVERGQRIVTNGLDQLQDGVVVAPTK
ncbi:efflux RND transporter periplasmic adaptor subunit [Hymenobacter aerilatus]|uniref:Efflux RND transporter periplasmic adaptor subunit n=1 Tax=Hymenobacter aerilatus TaxID=2932251 RepID=A0A8T9SVW8_9BACT|nr:efflux RND transporter periplasmic adaptor subunit [Hymenobacter aerilatus]UOR05541.1 efflux RND transporter periplasmic adaptor subunit [Hymenobacter aerilatus]